MKIEKISYHGWQNCFQLSNGRIKLIVTADVGPRIIFCGFMDGENLFYENTEQVGTTGGDAWKTYGGHRLWCSPEDEVTTYAPDNFPVEVQQYPQRVRFIAPVEATGIQKVIEISLSDEFNRAVITHLIINRASAPLTFAPWALTVMRSGGMAIIPHNLDYPHQLLPTHSFALWGYTQMSDPRWSWGDRYIFLRQDPKAATPQKCGINNKYGWAGYAVNGQLFVKRFGYQPDAAYPDFNCNFEAYTNSAILELESLGPLRVLEPGANITHMEEWTLFKNIKLPASEAEVDKNILPFINE